MIAKMHPLSGSWRPRISWVTAAGFFSLLLLCCSPVRAQSSPEAVIPIGDGPYALDLSADGENAIVSLLFPADDNDPNLFWVDLESAVVRDRFRFGRRLFRIATVDPSLLSAGNASASPVVLVNGDVDKLTVADLSSGQATAQIRTGQNPSNVEVIQTAGTSVMGGASNVAAVTNGTGGSVSFIDLDSNTPITEIDVGQDPRATATTPDGRYLLVVLRVEDSVAVLDLQSATPSEVARVGVGQDPTDIKISSDGSRAVVANLTNNTVSVLDISDPVSPRVIRDAKSNGLQLPVGIQPTSLALSPDGANAYVANAGSNWVTVLDLQAPSVLGILPIQQPESSIASAAAAVAVTPDGSKLVVAESGNAASLLVYDRLSLLLEPLPDIEIPDEPGTNVLLERADGEACGFYTSALTLQQGAEPGFWGMEVLTTAGNRLLEGGINLGGAFDADARNPGFGAFNIANRANENQIVELSIQAAALPTEGFSLENLGLSVQIVDGNREPVTEEVTGTDLIAFQAELPPGFYIVRIKSLPGSPRGTFLMAMTTRFTDRAGGGFQGGANVGGYIARKEDGNSTTAFAGFCLSESQQVLIRSEAGTSRGPLGAGNLILTIRDRNRDLVQRVSNSVPEPPPVEPPPPPSTDGLRVDLYVDASARPGGTGSSSRPFRSITEAVGKAASRNDVILVRPGIYSPSLTGEVLPIGSPGPGLNRIPEGVLLIGSGAAETIIDAENTLRDGSPVNAMGVGADGVRIAGFTVRNSSAVGIFLLNSDNAIIDSNFFIGNGRFGVGASGTGGLVLNGNVARANNETGFSVASAPVRSVSNPPPGCPSSFGACIIRNIANEHSRDGFLMTTGGDYQVIENTAMNNGISGIEINNRGNATPLNSRVLDNLTANNGGVLFPFSGTGILITEFAHAEEISGNQVVNNRPGGIAVFEDATAVRVEDNVIQNSKQNGLIIQKRSYVESVTGNQVVDSGLAGIFVENSAEVDNMNGNLVQNNGTCSNCTAAKGGLAILGDSVVRTVHDNSFDRNSLGMQIANGSMAETVTQSTFNNSGGGGVLVRQNSSIPNFSDNEVRNNRGASSVALDESSGMIARCEITAPAGVGVSLFQASTLMMQESSVSNALAEGIAVYEGSQLDLSFVDVLNNGDSGILTAGAGTAATIADSAVTGNNGYGLNAQGESSITCTGSTVVSGNAQGQTLGNVTGCN